MTAQQDQEGQQEHGVRSVSFEEARDEYDRRPTAENLAAWWYVADYRSPQADYYAEQAQGQQKQEVR